MIIAIWDSFCRALIRFFDNRFVVSNKENFYELEIARLHQQINRLLEERKQPPVQAEQESFEDQIAMNPIESTFQKRARLEKESRGEWLRQVAETKLKMDSQVKTTEELEKLVGVN